MMNVNLFIKYLNIRKNHVLTQDKEKLNKTLEKFIKKQDQHSTK